MVLCRVRIPVVVEITTVFGDPAAAVPRARAFLGEQYGRMLYLDDTECLDRQAGEEMRAWAQTAGIRVEEMNALLPTAG